MDDAVLVREREGVGGLNTKSDGGARDEGAVIDQITQRTTVDIFHGDEVSTASLADFVDGADMWMVERGGVAGFVQEASARSVIGALTVDDFYGPLAVEARVVGQIHSAHPTAAQQPLQPVRAESHARREAAAIRVHHVTIGPLYRVDGLDCCWI